jgi:parvulin-like peptidyl-prolyl isomerase
MTRLVRWFRVWWVVTRDVLAWGGLMARATLEVLAAALVVKTDEARACFEAHPEAFVIPEQVRLRSIVVKDEAQAGELAQRAAGSESFSRLAHQFNVSHFARATRGRMGWVGRGEDLGSEFAEIESALFDLRPGESAGPFRTSLGLHVVKCDRRCEPRQRTFREAKPLVKWWLYVNRATLGAQPAKGA